MALIADKTFSFNLARAQLLQDVFQADQQDPSLGMSIVTRTGTVSTSRRVMQLWSRLVRDVMSSLPVSAAQEPLTIILPDADTTAVNNMMDLLLTGKTVLKSDQCQKNILRLAECLEMELLNKNISAEADLNTDGKEYEWIKTEDNIINCTDQDASLVSSNRREPLMEWGNNEINSTEINSDEHPRNTGLKNLNGSLKPQINLKEKQVLTTHHNHEIESANLRNYSNFLKEHQKKRKKKMSSRQKKRLKASLQNQAALKNLTWMDRYLT